MYKSVNASLCAFIKGGFQSIMAAIECDRAGAVILASSSTFVDSAAVVTKSARRENQDLSLLDGDDHDV